MKLKITKVKELHEALLQLDGLEKVAHIDGKDKIVKEPFKLSGKSRWNIAKNVGILARKLEGFDKVRNDLVQEISEGKNIITKDETEKIKAFEKEIISVLETEEEIEGILTITKTDLNLDANAIPTWVIIALEPIITE